MSTFLSQKALTNPFKQRLIVGYGYRTSNDRKSLEKLAIDCWRSINPPSSPIINSTSRTRVKNTNSKRPIERDSSVSSADVPLAQVKDTKKKKGKSKETPLNIVDSQDSPNGANRAKSSKGKSTIGGKVDEKDKDNEVAKSGKVDLSKRFYDMIMNDQELWLRILRYEVSLTEFRSFPPLDLLSNTSRNGPCAARETNKTFLGH